jgi:hypothetical protein
MQTPRAGEMSAAIISSAPDRQGSNTVGNRKRKLRSVRESTNFYPVRNARPATHCIPKSSFSTMRWLRHRGKAGRCQVADKPTAPPASAARKILTPTLKVSNRSRLLRRRHVRITADHFDLSFDEGARLGAVFLGLRRLSSESIAHVNDRCVGLFLSLFNRRRCRWWARINWHGTFSSRRHATGQLLTTKA